MASEKKIWQERTKIERFWHYSKMWGCNEFAQPESPEDKLYTESQRDFFLEYELQLEDGRLRF